MEGMEEMHGKLKFMTEDPSYQYLSLNNFPSHSKPSPEYYIDLGGHHYTTLLYFCSVVQLDMEYKFVEMMKQRLQCYVD